MRCTQVRLLTSIGLGLFFAALGSAQDGNQSPILAQSVLSVRGEQLHPVQSGDDPGETWLGNIGIAVSRGKVGALNAAGGVVWERISPTKDQAHLVASDDEFLYLVADDTDSNIVYRMLRASGAAASPIKTSISAKDKSQIVGIAAESGYVVIAGCAKDKGYTVDCFKKGESAPIWTKSYPATGYVEGYRASFMLRAPTRQHEDPIPLLIAGDSLVLCLNRALPLTSLALRNGGVRWQIDKIWQFRRGFIGPSVFSYYISRFGFFDFGDPKRTAEKVKENDKESLYQGYIASGPYLAPCDSNTDSRGSSPSEESHLFVVCGIPTSSMVMSEFLYELDDQAKIQTITPLSRPIDANPMPLSDGLAVPMDKDGLLQIRTSQPNPNLGDMGPWKDKDDYVGDIVSMNNLHVSKTIAWMTATNDSTPAARFDNFCIRLVGRPFIKTSDSKAIYFPVAIAKLNNGGCVFGELMVPFTHLAEIPESNYNSDGHHYDLLTPYMLFVEQIETVGGNLRFIIARDKQKWFADFSIADLTKTLGK